MNSRNSKTGMKQRCTQILRIDPIEKHSKTQTPFHNINCTGNRCINIQTEPAQVQQHHPSTMAPKSYNIQAAEAAAKKVTRNAKARRDKVRSVLKVCRAAQETSKNALESACWQVFTKPNPKPTKELKKKVDAQEGKLSNLEIKLDRMVAEAKIGELLAKAEYNY
jgi:DNA-binding transcriptional regulator of glucitol operon